MVTCSPSSRASPSHRSTKGFESGAVPVGAGVPAKRPVQNRVGGGFTPAVLSHHRAYGSVHGGSGYATKPVDRIQYRDQSELIPQFLR
ncbi:hypothetical protein DZC31_26315 [Stenotrophomonas rhizophila]|nr:hypothetical protein DZC31_26315 [Stenotrophomonas rhizophila]